jgi:hypothetical protein
MINADALRKCCPKRQENIVTERPIDGAWPINANENNEARMRVSFINEPLVLESVSAKANEKQNKADMKPRNRQNMDRLAYW